MKTVTRFPLHSYRWALFIALPDLIFIISTEAFNKPLWAARYSLLRFFTLSTSSPFMPSLFSRHIHCDNAFFKNGRSIFDMANKRIELDLLRKRTYDQGQDESGNMIYDILIQNVQTPTNLCRPHT